ncbi:MAG: hypothetical protein K2X87_03645 [Gemmataceae bacterium]|nr:hypothetical protein [Gemmataceae bacterium]
MCDRNKVRPIVEDLIRITHELATEARRFSDRVEPAGEGPGSGPRFDAVPAELRDLLVRLTEPAAPCRGPAARQALAG